MISRATDSGIRLQPPTDSHREVRLRPVAPRRIGPRAFVALVGHLTIRELRSANHLTLLGWGWPVFRQLAQLAVLVFVFGAIFDFGVENYAVFVFIGLMAWSWFAGGITGAAYAVIGQRHLVMQPRLPAAVLPLVAVAVPFVDLVFALPVLVVMLVATTGLGWGLLACPLLIVVQLVLMAGIAWLLAAASVFLRDVPNLVGVVLLMLFYLTPVFYARTAVPDRFRWVLDANPVGTIIEAYRALLLDTPGPGLERLAPLVIVSAALAFLGFAAFRRVQPRFTDYL